MINNDLLLMPRDQMKSELMLEDKFQCAILSREKISSGLR